MKAGLILALALLAGGAALAQAVTEPDGYRGEPYRAAVPATLLGVPALTPNEALALHRSGEAVFIDVLPRTDARPAGLPEDTIWQEPPHRSIPGAIWLPNVGYQALAPQDAAFFRAGLDAASGGRRDAALVFFCKRDCWMSWNAARRAVEQGYTNVRWFAEGQDGWTDLGGSLVPVLAWSGP